MENNLLFEQVRNSAKPVLDTAKQRASGVSKAAKHFIKANPALALGLALGMGVFMGWLIKRR